MPSLTTTTVLMALIRACFGGVTGSTGLTGDRWGRVDFAPQPSPMPFDRTPCGQSRSNSPFARQTKAPRFEALSISAVPGEVLELPLPVSVGHPT
jgi:hypothetical protein